jgi:formamidase
VHRALGVGRNGTPVIRDHDPRRLSFPAGTLRNRWHAQPEPVFSAAPGELLAIPTIDGFDGQLTATSTHADVASIDLYRSHPLSGPIWVEGARPGDVLEIDFVAYETASFGITALIPNVGLLSDDFPEPYLLKWQIEHGRATSPELPGVSVPEATFAGVVGVAPDPRLLAEWFARELAGPEESPTPHREARFVGATTVPPRETGGNLDIARLTAGSKLRLPVRCEGALVSIGDLHFAQGDGEVCGTAVEIAGAAHLRFNLVRDVVNGQLHPSYLTPARPGRSVLATTGIPVREGQQWGVADIRLAAQNAVREMIAHLTATYGFSRPAAYALCSAVVDLRLSEVVNAPNCLVSAELPLDIFRTG